MLLPFAFADDFIFEYFIASGIVFCWIAVVISVSDVTVGGTKLIPPPVVSIVVASTGEVTADIMPPRVLFNRLVLEMNVDAATLEVIITRKKIAVDFFGIDIDK